MPTHIRKNTDFSRQKPWQLLSAEEDFEENWGYLQLNLNMVGFLTQTFFFSMSQTFFFSISLNPFEPLPIEMSLCNYENLLDLGASLSEYVRAEGCYSNITSNFVAKINAKTSQTILKSWKETLTSSSKSMKFLLKRKMKFWTFPCIKWCCSAYKRYNEILLQIGNYNILQNTILRQSLRHVASLLGNN